LTQIPDTLLEWILAIAGGSTLIVFAVALQNFFVRPPRLTKPQRLFQDLSVVIGLLHGFGLLVLPSAGDNWAAIGIAMYALSLGLFLNAIEAARRTPMTRTFVYEPRCDRILSTGPYRVIRHPIYLSYSLAWFAAPVAVHSVVLLITALFMTTCYLLSAAEEERRLAAGPLAEDYKKRLAVTWRIIPFVY